MESNEAKRFDEDASTIEEAKAYYRNRALQLACRGWRLQRLRELPFGVEATFFSPTGETYYSVYVLFGHRGKGHLTRWFDEEPARMFRFVTMPDCTKIRTWLDRNVPHYTVVGRPGGWAYEAIQLHYGDTRATRSGRFYMDHIDEGLFILNELGASSETKEAWCIHPLVQANKGMIEPVYRKRCWLQRFRPTSVLLAMEYRERANAFLSHHLDAGRSPDAGVLLEVQQMLIADKVQNRKDLEEHNHDLANYADLLLYFKKWFSHLGVGEKKYKEWKDKIVNIRRVE